MQKSLKSKIPMILRVLLGIWRQKSWPDKIIALKLITMLWESFCMNLWWVKDLTRVVQENKFDNKFSPNKLSSRKSKFPKVGQSKSQILSINFSKEDPLQDWDGEALNKSNTILGLKIFLGANSLTKSWCLPSNSFQSTMHKMWDIKKLKTVRHTKKQSGKIKWY